MVYELSKDFSKIRNEEFLEVYKKQVSIYQDYFHHPKFQEQCLLVFSNYQDCYLFTVRNNDKLIGYCALKQETIFLRKISYTVLVPVSYKVSEYNYPIIDSKYIDVFFKSFNENFKDYNIFYPNTPSFFSRRFLNSVKNMFVYSITENPILKNNKDEFSLAASKKGIVRDYKQLGNKYNLELSHHTEKVSEKDINTFFDLHIKRWERDDIDSKFKQEKFRSIYTELLKLDIEGVGSSVFSTLKADSSLIAVHYGFLSKKRFIYQVPVYDIDFNTNKSPGAILLKGIFEFNIDKENNIFDMGTGLENYKYRFMNDIDIYFNLILFKKPVHRFINKIKLK